MKSNKKIILTRQNGHKFQPQTNNIIFLHKKVQNKKKILSYIDV